VLAVVHNTTAATRLLDILPLFATDPRIDTVFTCPGSSAFPGGTDEFLARAGITDLLPWKQALRRESDLAVAASYGGDLHKIKAPLMVVPHGMGYNKYLATRGRSPVFGMDSAWLMHRGRLVPSVIVLSHPEQLDRLAAACPPAGKAALVAGDPCFDRMLASLPLRETYRQALGITPGQRLVVISSTWGDASLYGADPGLVHRLARRLDLDSYRLAVALHPNIESHHLRWQTRMWLDDCARAGVLVLPDEDHWRPALVAADLTIGDHGSVTFYSAALGTPLLLASAPAEKVDPRSPIAKLLRTAPRFDAGADPAAQIERALARHDPADLAPITELTTAMPGGSAAALREAIYRCLELPAPASPAGTRVLPVPEITVSRPTAQLVRVDFDGVEPKTVRFAADSLRDPELVPEDTHLVVDTREPAGELLNIADVVVHDRPHDSERWISETLRALPGCLVAVARDVHGWLAGTTDGLRARLDDPVTASVLYACLVTGRALPASITVLTPTRSTVTRPIRPAG
jgi:hypothetical protein